MQQQLCAAFPGISMGALLTKSENLNALMALGTSSLFSRFDNPKYDAHLLTPSGTYALISMDRALLPRKLSEVSTLGCARLLVQLITLSHCVSSIIPLNGQSDWMTFDAMKAYLLYMLVVFAQLILPGALQLMSMESLDNCEESELCTLVDEIRGCGSVNRMVVENHDLHPCEVCNTVYSAFTLCLDECAVSVDEKHLGAVLMLEIFEDVSGLDWRKFRPGTSLSDVL